MPDVPNTPQGDADLVIHNAEINTDPTVLSREGLAAQADAIRERTAAARAAARAHERAMRACRPGMHEYQLEAELKEALIPEDPDVDREVR